MQDHRSREMSVRFSLKTVLRDCVIMLCGTVLGILLAQGFMTSHRTAIAHLTKREHPLAVSVKSTERPKTIASELNVSSIQPLYIGVVTAQNLLSTRAAAVNHTWGQKAPKLEFFSSLDHADSTLGLPIVSLDGVDDRYPPQKKVFRMLKYMYDHYINEYNWFMRADDDVYVCVEHLMHFLSKLDPSRILYIGQPGGGKPQDLARIKMKPHEHYCMGGPGVIFSRALLIKLAPHLEDCLEHEVVSWNEDLEVGRCISRRLGVQCTWNYEACWGSIKMYTPYQQVKGLEITMHTNL